MDSGRMLPTDPLRFIQRCVKQRKILWTYHVHIRLKDRAIPRRAILESVDSFEIIEAYPEDKYLPSYLVYCQYGDEVLHVVFATDVPDDNVRMVTAYRPRLEEWEADLRTRRRAR